MSPMKQKPQEPGMLSDHPEWYHRITHTLEPNCINKTTNVQDGVKLVI